MSASPILECPVCAAVVSVEEGAVQGEIVLCADCGSELEVLTLTPLAIGVAPEVEEDWGE